MGSLPHRITPRIEPLDEDDGIGAILFMSACVLVFAFGIAVGVALAWLL